jgi:hypothetical protein
VKGQFRRPSMRIAAMALASIATGILSVGCASSPSTSNQVSNPPHPGRQAPAQSARAESSAQKAAQQEWCSYLEALYLRAVDGAPTWPKREECMSASTLASPEMLSRTARCSREALDAFAGDPFTTAYANAVSRCGTEALDAVEASPSELTPFVASICGRMSTCESKMPSSSTYAECRDSLESGLGPHLERAVGAMNPRGREELQVCLKQITCGDLGTQLAGCLEPIMDGLLWLPG